MPDLNSILKDERFYVDQNGDPRSLKYKINILSNIDRDFKNTDPVLQKSKIESWTKDYNYFKAQEKEKPDMGISYKTTPKTKQEVREQQIPDMEGLAMREPQDTMMDVLEEESPALLGSIVADIILPTKGAMTVKKLQRVV